MQSPHTVIYCISFLYYVKHIVDPAAAIAAAVAAATNYTTTATTAVAAPVHIFFVCIIFECVI